jgi:hypothetical protein
MRIILLLPVLCMMIFFMQSKAKTPPVTAASACAKEEWVKLKGKIQCCIDRTAAES